MVNQAEVVLADDEECDEKHKEFTRFSVKILRSSVKHEEKHEAKIS